MIPVNINNIRLLLVVGIAAMLLLFISFLLIFIFTQRKKMRYQQLLYNLRQQQQTQLIEAAVQSEETERLRIAEVLHDEVGALLSSSKLHFQSFRAVGAETSDQILLTKGNELLNEAINKIRGMAQTLHSQILREFGLTEAILHFTNNIAHASVIKVTTSLDTGYTTLVPQTDMMIYRIIQELINNIIKHAGANYIHVALKCSPADLNIAITHNGNGLTQALFEDLRYNKNGLGLKNIQNRLNLLKGTINFNLKDDIYNIDMNFLIT
jgi:two-component system NarL family sensor kinase